ncbi:hypothetical protein KBB49_00270 [Candidatus Saccharibacteria bacterium]|nr:hypothetical protein [Candidatus Saccharibacteria bacterium]
MMGILPRYIAFGERKLGIDFPQVHHEEGDTTDMGPHIYEEPTFSKEQRQFFVDTAKVAITDFVGSAVQMRRREK